MAHLWRQCWLLLGVYVLKYAIGFGNIVNALEAHYTGELCPLRFCWIRLNKHSLLCESTERRTLWTSLTYMCFSLWLTEITFVLSVLMTLRITELFITFYHSSRLFIHFITSVISKQGRTQGGGGCRATAPPKPPKPTFKKNTDFVETMVSKVLRGFPFSRNRLMSSTLEF